MFSIVETQIVRNGLPMIGPNVANGAFVANIKLRTIGRYLLGTSSPILPGDLAGETQSIVRCRGGMTYATLKLS